MKIHRYFCHESGDQRTKARTFVRLNRLGSRLSYYSYSLLWCFPFSVDFFILFSLFPFRRPLFRTKATPKDRENKSRVHIQLAQPLPGSVGYFVASMLTSILLLASLTLLASMMPSLGCSLPSILGCLVASMPSWILLLCCRSLRSCGGRLDITC
jgi:hypothetical protein